MGRERRQGQDDGKAWVGKGQSRERSDKWKGEMSVSLSLIRQKPEAKGEGMILL